jgi:hypothetical protein
MEVFEVDYMLLGGAVLAALARPALYPALWPRSSASKELIDGARLAQVVGPGSQPLRMTGPHMTPWLADQPDVRRATPADLPRIGRLARPSRSIMTSTPALPGYKGRLLTTRPS